MTSAVVRRLPGFAFEARAPRYEDVLPRMDVAVFAGFAASGPVNLPVPVEDPAQFAAVFGADAPLAWDVDLGRTVYAQLAPAVRMFFANGGRRCWVVRLAGEARPNRLPVPGVATVTAKGAWATLALTARSPGSWSDSVELSASLTSRRLGIEWKGDTRELQLLAPNDTALGVGDLLRLTWRDAGVQLYLAVKSVIAGDAGVSGPRRSRLHVQTGREQWFDTTREPAERRGTARLATGAVAAEWATPVVSPPDDGDDRVTIGLDVRAQDAPHAGEVVLARFGAKAEELMLCVDDAALVTAKHSPPDLPVVVRGKALWRRAALPALPAPPGPPSVERLGLDLWARVGTSDVRRIGELGLAPGHVRHVALLPDDEAVYGPGDAPELDPWPDAITPRFPAAGTTPRRDAADGDAPDFCIPFGVGAVPEHYLPARRPEGAALERDGLVPFDPVLFADASVTESLAPTLLADAEFVRFLGPVPRPRLAGLHGVLAIEEATLVAVPDAVHRGWVAAEEGEPLPPDKVVVLDAEGPCDDDFVDCDEVLGPAPVLEAIARDADASIALEWTGAERSEAFVVEEATSRDWRGAVVVYEGPERTKALTGRRPGDYYYRVRGVGLHATEWSRGAPVRLTPGRGWRARRREEYDDDVLVAVHRLLLRICAARRDVMAVLSLPEHYREDAAAAHMRLLARQNAPEIPLRALADARAPRVPPLASGEADAFGFAALYHGWLHARDEGGALRTLAPDGAVCGMIARRALERGAWVAPANERLRGVVALERPAAPSRWLDLQALQINALRPDPRGGSVMSADTLAGDEDVRPIGVRRLLILLRRVAIRLGATYVFEPNDDAFRRMVQRGFEAMLTDLFQRGAFAAATAARAFQVVTGESLNTRPSVDKGRFIVELRVAPSRPMTFLTLRLVQTGERVAVIGA
jgi:hypothetical protein